MANQSSLRNRHCNKEDYGKSVLARNSSTLLFIYMGHRFCLRKCRATFGLFLILGMGKMRSPSSPEQTSSGISRGCPPYFPELNRAVCYE